VATVVDSNPALNSQAAQELLSQPAERTMTVAGVSVKTLLFLALVVLAGWWGWVSATEPVAADSGGGYGTTTVTLPGGFWLASFAALVVRIFTSFNPRMAAGLGAIYALLEGYVLGAISAAFDAQTEGIVAAAILGTVCVFAVALLLYVTRIVRPTQRMAFGVVAGIGGLALLYLVVWVLAIVDASFLYSEEFRAVGLIVTIIAVVLAALSLTLTFASIEGLVAGGAPRHMEWYMAYSLMVTLIWLYIELLRLLALLARNR
jgi:uncharacterized YccA/Bax inhibitor family protein